MILISEWTDTGSVSNNSFYRSSSLPDQRYQALLTINQAIVNKRPSPFDTYHSRSLSLNTEEDAIGSSSNCSGIKDGVSIACSSRSYQTDNKLWISDQESLSEIMTDLSLSGQVMGFLSVNQCQWTRNYGWVGQAGVAILYMHASMSKYFYSHVDGRPKTQLSSDNKCNMEIFRAKCISIAILKKAGFWRIQLCSNTP